MAIEIKINSDGIWGDTDMDSINERASEDALSQMVADAVAAEYGDVEVSVENVGRTQVKGVDSDDDKEIILGIVSDVWQTWDWIVDAR